MTDSEMVEVLQRAIDWIIDIPTPDTPRPSAWSDVQYREYWRGERMKILKKLEEMRLEISG